MSANALLSPPKARPGDRVAVLSPSFAAPAVAPEVHEQAMRRLQEITGLIPVEYPTTRKLGARPRERARDLMAAFADDSIRAICATIGGDDQITVIPHLDPEVVRAHPKPFLGYSDNTHLHHFLTTCGLRSFYGGSTQVHLGPGPHVDPEHAAGLRAALLTGEKLKITRPAQSEDHGLDWGDPAVLTSFGQREDTEEWTWAGPRAGVTGRTWGGCLEVVSDLLAAGRFAMAPTDLEGAVLLIELSEEITPTRAVFRMLRALGERGVLAAAAAGGGPRPGAGAPGRSRTATAGPGLDEPDPLRRRRPRPPPDAPRRRDPQGNAGRAQRDGHRDDRRLQPAGRRVLRRPLRAHLPAVDPALRRSGRYRRCGADGGG